MPKGQNTSNEKARIENLLKKGQITRDDYQSLLSAIEKDDGTLQKVFMFLANPFQFLSIGPALTIGIFSIAIMSIIGAHLGFHYIGALDFKIVAEGERFFSAPQLLLQNLINVFSLSGVFYLGARLSKGRNLRLVDFVGSIALSRFPYAIFAPTIFSLAPIFPGLLPRKTIPQESTTILALALIAVSFLAWQITLAFSALKESSGLKDKKLWITFGVGLVVAEALSITLNKLVLFIVVN